LFLIQGLHKKYAGSTIEEAQKIAKTAMSQKVVEDEVKRKLLGKKFAARGNMSKSEFGIALVATDAWEPPGTIREKAQKFLESIGY